MQSGDAYARIIDMMVHVIPVDVRKAAINVAGLTKFTVLNSFATLRELC